MREQCNVFPFTASFIGNIVPGGGSLWDLAAGGVGVYRPKSRTIGSEFNLNRSDRICLMSAAAKAQQRMKNGAKPAAAADDDGFPGFGPRQSKSLPDKRHYHRYQSHIEWSNINNNNDNDTNASTLRICVLGGKKVGKTGNDYYDWFQKE